MLFHSPVRTFRPQSSEDFQTSESVVPSPNAGVSWSLRLNQSCFSGLIESEHFPCEQLCWNLESCTETIRVESVSSRQRPVARLLRDTIISRLGGLYWLDGASFFLGTVPSIRGTSSPELHICSVGQSRLIVSKQIPLLLMSHVPLTVIFNSSEAAPKVNGSRITVCAPNVMFWRVTSCLSFKCCGVTCQEQRTKMLYFRGPPATVVTAAPLPRGEQLFWALHLCAWTTWWTLSQLLLCVCVCVGGGG